MGFHGKEYTPREYRMVLEIEYRGNRVERIDISPSVLCLGQVLITWINKMFMSHDILSMRFTKPTYEQKSLF